MRHTFLFVIILVFALVPGNILTGTPVHAQPADSPYQLPVRPRTSYYLTGTPRTHSADGSDASIDLQITNDRGLVWLGAPLYAPVSGYARYAKSENGSGMIIIRSTDDEYEVVLAHILDDTKYTKKVLDTYPRHVIAGELIAFQGNSGYINGARLPTHVHMSVFVRSGDEYENPNKKIRICERIGVEHYCEFIDRTNEVILVNK